LPWISYPDSGRINKVLFTMFIFGDDPDMVEARSIELL